MAGGNDEIFFCSLEIPVFLQIFHRQVISVQRACRRLFCNGKLNILAVSIGDDQRVLKLRHGKRFRVRIPPVPDYILTGARHILIKSREDIYLLFIDGFLISHAFVADLKDTRLRLKLRSVPILNAQPFIFENLLILSAVLNAVIRISFIRRLFPAPGTAVRKLRIGKGKTCSRHDTVRLVVLPHHFFVRKKIFCTVRTAFHAVVGCSVQTIPFTVYLYIIPHMQIITAVRRPVAPLYEYTFDAQSIQNRLHRPGIPLTKTLSLHESAIGCTDILIITRSSCIHRIIYDRVVYINHLFFDRTRLAPRALHDLIDPALMCFDRILHRTLTGKALCKISVRPAGSERGTIHHRIIVRHTGIRRRFLRHTDGQTGKIHIENIRIVRIKGIPRRTEYTQNGFLIVGRQLLAGNMAVCHKIIPLFSGLEDALLIHLIHGIVDALCISIQLIVIIPLIIFVLRFYAAADSCQAKRKRKQNGQCGSQ